MKTITTEKEIAAAYNKTANPDMACPTYRPLSGQWERDNIQEWVILCDIDGAPAKVYYIFKNNGINGGDWYDLRWDVAHVSKIEIAEKDEDGDFENL